MKEQHIKWASSHDWYIGHGVDSENRVFIRVVEWAMAWETDTYLSFTDIQKLREWAGY